MKHLLLASAAIAALGIGAGSASASELHDGWYLSVGAGANWVEDTTVTTAFGAEIEGSADTGWALHGSIGYDFLESPLRLEVEFAHRANDIDEARVGAVTFTGLDDDVTQASAMVNLVLDFAVGEDTEFSLGAGIGLGRADIEVSGPALFVTDATDDLTLAYQGLAGFAFGVGDQTQLFLEYRYFVLTDHTVRTFPLGVPLDNDIDLTNQTASIGLRFFFDEPEAPVEAAPAPAPAPAPVTSYTVYFDFNKSNLTADGQAAVAEAVEARKSSDGPITIEVQGDGDPSMDAKLADRRAAAVKAAAISLGAPADSVSVETHEGGDATVTLN